VTAEKGDRGSSNGRGESRNCRAMITTSRVVLPVVTGNSNFCGNVEVPEITAMLLCYHRYRRKLKRLEKGKRRGAEDPGRRLLAAVGSSGNTVTR
jgi:hypothetical protein